MRSISHFEKKSNVERGIFGLFRRLEVSGSTFRITLGAASEWSKRFAVETGSAAAARRLAGAWSRWALDAGFAEVPLEAGTAGIVFHLETPKGPGRVRDDEGRNVLFDPDAAGDSSFRHGQRVVLQGVRKYRGASPDFMFGSKLRADRLIPFPVVSWSRFKARPGPTAKILKSLAAPARDPRPRERGAARGRRAGADLEKGLPFGTLVFAFEAGVHRFLARTSVLAVPSRRRLRGDFVITEPVLSRTLQRRSGRMTSQVATFCEPIPAALRRELERHFALGLVSTRR